MDREPCQREIKNKILKIEITKIYWQHHGRYESPKIHLPLLKEGHKRIVRLMQVMGFKSIQKRNSKRQLIQIIIYL